MGVTLLPSMSVANTGGKDKDDDEVLLNAASTINNFDVILTVHRR